MADLTEQEVQDKLMAIRQKQQITETANPSRVTSNVLNDSIEHIRIVPAREAEPCTTETCRGYCGRDDCPWPAAKRFRDLEHELAQIRKQKKHPERVLKTWQVPKKHLRASFDTFEGGEKLKDLCIKATDGYRSVFLTGATGTGKTHLAVAMMRLTVEKAGKSLETNPTKPPSAIFVTVPELLFELRQCYNDKAMSEADVMSKYSNVPLLVLDDLGAEKATEWAEMMLYLIVDRRDRECRWTIVTSNMGLAEIEAALGSRIASRLSNMTVANIKLPDYRKKRTTGAS